MKHKFLPKERCNFKSRSKTELLEEMVTFFLPWILCFFHPALALQLMQLCSQPGERSDKLETIEIPPTDQV